MDEFGSKMLSYDGGTCSVNVLLCHMWFQNEWAGLTYNACLNSLESDVLVIALIKCQFLNGTSRC